MDFSDLLLRTSIVCMEKNGVVSDYRIACIKQLFIDNFVFDNSALETKINALLQDLKSNANDFKIRFFTTLSDQALVGEQELQLLKVTFQTINYLNPISYHDIMLFKNIRSYLKISDELILKSIDGIDEEYIASDIISKRKPVNMGISNNSIIIPEIAFKFEPIPFDGYICPVNNSRGMFKNFFTATGRIRRKEYWISMFVLTIISCLILFLVKRVIDPPFVVGQLLSIFISIPLYIQDIKRCHDLGKSGWWIFVPIFNPFFLLFEEGENCVNEYGTNPKQSYESQAKQGPLGVTKIK